MVENIGIGLSFGEKYEFGLTEKQDGNSGV